MPKRGFGAGMYEEEDNSQHESGKCGVREFACAQDPIGMYEEEDSSQHESGKCGVREFARAQNPTDRDAIPLGCDPELNYHDFTDDQMEEDDYG